MGHCIKQHDELIIEICKAQELMEQSIRLICQRYPTFYERAEKIIQSLCIVHHQEKHVPTFVKMLQTKNLWMLANQLFVELTMLEYKRKNGTWSKVET